jgi:hypothetical protein
MMAWAGGGDGRWVADPEPTEQERREYLAQALDLYITAVAMAERSLPKPFTGLLRWAEPGNRPMLAALAGLAVALWRTGNYRASEAVLRTMLWICPNDDQNARLHLERVHLRQPFEATLTQLMEAAEPSHSEPTASLVTVGTIDHPQPAVALGLDVTPQARTAFEAILHGPGRWGQELTVDPQRCAETGEPEIGIRLWPVFEDLPEPHRDPEHVILVNIRLDRREGELLHRFGRAWIHLDDAPAPGVLVSFTEGGLATVQAWARHNAARHADH